MKYEELREMYPAFYYHGFSISENESELHIRFDFEIYGLSHFNPSFVLRKPNEKEVGNLYEVREAVFHLGMIELISYWKLTCSPNVIVECGSLNEEQLKWWKHLYFHGLGEFFYINHIDADPKRFMFIAAIGTKIDGEKDQKVYEGNLIPVGGGKDSFVSLDVLKGMYDQNTAFIINHIQSAEASAKVAGYQDEKLILVERSLDPRMLQLNQEGFLNGHTPFSALAAFASLLTAIVHGKKYICLSNEASANESTIKDSKVNHQYSKTFEFEKNFNWYVENYITKNVHYFSLLRPLSELQIAGIFATLSHETLMTFRSCNVGQKQGVWCGHCAKCLFVYLILSAYLNDEQLKEIFGVSMGEDASMMDLFEQLSGIQDNKPFECVGTREEVNIAICMSIANHLENNQPIPLLYKRYMETEFYTYYKDRKVDMLAYQEENLLPDCYETILKERLLEVSKQWKLA